MVFRCVDDEMPQKSDGLPVYGSENASSECLVEAAFSGKVSVSVADAGETAVIVSLVEGNRGTEESSRNLLSSLDVCKEPEVDALKHNPGANTLLSSCTNNHKLETPSSERSIIEPNLRTQELELSLSKVTSFSAPSNSLDFTELKTNSDDKGMDRPAFDGFGVSSSKSLGELQNNESHGLGLHLGLSACPSSSGSFTNFFGIFF